MKPIFLMLFGLCWTGLSSAQQLYSDGFDPPVIKPMFPLVGGVYQLPSGPSTTQLQWLIGELAASETTSIAEINAHFDPAAFSTMTAAQWKSFIDGKRAQFPNAFIRDVVMLTPVRATLVIASPGAPPPYGFMNVGAKYTGTQRIVQFTLSDYYGSVQYPVDQTLTMIQAADKFTTLSTAPSLLVGRINSAGQCTEMTGRNATTPRATASIFKLWILGGLGRAIALGVVGSADLLPMVASEIAPGGIINIEPLNTPFPVRDLARLMIGISDNTATDLMHQLLGRTFLNQVVIDYGVTQPDLLTPLLGISEQFHLFTSFNLSTAMTYVNGTQAFKNQFLQDNIVPLGPNTGGPFANTTLYTDGSWRASPTDVCRAFGQMLRLPQGSEALMTVDAAAGAGVAQPEVRAKWDRVWYKGGSLASSANGYHVLTHAWMLQNAGKDPYVVIAMSNSVNGNIDQFQVQSVTGRLLQLVYEMSLLP